MAPAIKTKQKNMDPTIKSKQKTLFQLSKQNKRCGARLRVPMLWKQNKKNMGLSFRISLKKMFLLDKPDHWYNRWASVPLHNTVKHANISSPNTSFILQPFKYPIDTFWPNMHS